MTTGLRGADLTEFVTRARGGDSQAVADLYDRTYGKVYVTVRAMIKDEDAVFDIVQDSYMKAFAHLDRLQDGNFLPWVKTIAANTARDWLKKQRPLLFSELNTDEEMDEPAEARFADECSEHLPEWVIEQNETKRLIREILEGLPEDQRAAISMFYYEELSVKDIAAAMGCSESAVKSRLMYGRKKIEKEVRELEKKGTKLYGLAPIPFLLWLLRGEEVYADVRPDGRILQQLLRQADVPAAEAGRSAVRTGSGAAARSAARTAAGQAASAAGQTAAKTAGAAAAAAGTGAAAASAAAGTAAGLGGLKLGLIIAAAVVVLGGGTFGIIKAVSGRGGAGDPSAIATAAPGTVETLPGPGRTESAPPQTGPQGTAAPETQTTAPETAEAETSETVTEAPEQDSVAEALARYREILENADSYDFGGPVDMTPTGYLYALVQLHEEHEVPTLLLAKEWEEMYYETLLFRYEPADGSMTQSSATLSWGMQGIGGFRGGLALPADGDGLMNTEFSAGTGMGAYTLVAFRKKALTKTVAWEGRLDEEGQPELKEIEWAKLPDMSVLEDWEGQPGGNVPSGTGTPGDAAQTTRSGGLNGPEGTAAPEEAGPQAVTLPSDGSRIVFAGTIRKCSYEETIELQGYPDPNAPWTDHSRTFLLLILDEPQEMSLHSGDDNSMHAGEVDLIRVTDEYEKYAGEHHIFSIDPNVTYWPTDTSMPLGRPGTGDLHILD